MNLLLQSLSETLDDQYGDSEGWETGLSELNNGGLTKKNFSDDLKKRILWEIINTASFYSFIMNFAFPHFSFPPGFNPVTRTFTKVLLPYLLKKCLMQKSL